MVVLACSVAVVIRTKYVHAPVAAQNTDTVPNINVPFTYVVLPESVTLSSEQIAHTFSLLAPALSAYNQRPEVPAYRQGRPLDTYIYQLNATITSTGSLIVHVTALPPRQESDPLWKVSSIDVADGGPEYFDATVDLAVNAVTDIFVHGEA